VENARGEYGVIGGEAKGRSSFASRHLRPLRCVSLFSAGRAETSRRGEGGGGVGQAALKSARLVRASRGGEGEEGRREGVRQGGGKDRIADRKRERDRERERERRKNCRRGTLALLASGCEYARDAAMQTRMKMSRDRSEKMMTK